MTLQIIETGDGSHTLFSPDFDEIYHSRHGAIGESDHIFIRSGLEAIDKREIEVFEVGFGTGLNAYLSFLYATKQGIKIDYHTVELYPVHEDVIARINYPERLNGSRNDFNRLHEAMWGTSLVISPHFTLHKIPASLLDLKLDIKVDVIFFDAFSPDKQPGLWTAEVFKQMYDMLEPGGILVTYCSKSYVRKNMQQAGFTIEKLPGPPGKRDMVRARKS